MTRDDRLIELAEQCRNLVRKHQPKAHSSDWFRIANADDGDRAELFIYGYIGDDWDPDDVTAGSFTRALRDITAPAIDLHINSPGGLVWDGIAIHAAIRNHPATVAVHVDGIAASAASFVAMAGDTVAVEKPAKMMIHDASGIVLGNAADMLEMAERLDEISDTIAGIYADRAGGTVEQWRDAMRAETWYSAEQAVAVGLADTVANDAASTAATKTSGPILDRASSKDSTVHAVAWNNLDRGAKGMDIEEILAAMKSLIDAAEGRTLTDDEVKRYETLENKLAEERTHQLRQRQKQYEAPAPDNVQLAQTAAVVHTAPAKDDDGLDKAFNHFMRTGRPNADIADLRITNAQAIGTDSAGGFTVPEGFRQKLVDRMVAFGGLANEAEEITTDTGVRLPWPTLDDTSNEGVIAAEGSAPSSGGADLVFGEKELGSFRYVAPGASNLPLRVSVELLQDSAFDIEALVARKLGERIARSQATDWAVGVGVTEPEGITDPAADFTFPTGNTTSVTKDIIIDLLHTLDPEYRTNASWLINDATLAEVRKLEDSNGRPLWQPFAGSGMETVPGGILLGHRVVIDQAMPNMAVSAKSWVFGDLRESYIIRRVRDLQLVVNPWARANEGQVEYVLWARADGAIQNDNSFVVGANSAT